METKMKKDVAVSPNGFVSFVSAIFGKKSKDESGFVEHNHHKFIQQQKQFSDMAWINSPWI